MRDTNDMYRIGGSIPAPYVGLYLPTISTPDMPYFVMGAASGRGIVWGTDKIRKDLTIGPKDINFKR